MSPNCLSISSAHHSRNPCGTGKFNPNSIFASGETRPKEAQRFAQGHEPAFPSVLPQVLEPAYSPGTSLSQGHSSGPESRPVPGHTCCCPMGFQGGSCQTPRQFYFPRLQSAENNCQTSGTSVSLKAWLPFHPFHRQQPEQGPQSLFQLLGSFISSWEPSPDSPR